jgi:hypothetical protein
VLFYTGGASIAALFWLKYYFSPTPHKQSKGQKDRVWISSQT